MTRSGSAGLGVGLALLSLAGIRLGLVGPEARPAAAQVAAGAPLRPAVATSLRDTLGTEKDSLTRIFLAKGLIRVAPDDDAAARELVTALQDPDRAADAYQALQDVIPGSSPALVRRLLPVLRSQNADDRRRAAILLTKLNPQALP